MWIVENLSDLPSDWKLIKTHAHFRGENLSSFRAVFVWGYVEDIIASLMSISDEEWMLTHLNYLQVAPEDIRRWTWLRSRRMRIRAWRYLLEEDKLQFVENIRSWARAKALFIKYEKLCARPERKFHRISDFIGCEIPVPAIQSRQSCWRDLPDSILETIYNNYPSWIRRTR